MTMLVHPDRRFCRRDPADYLQMFSVASSSASSRLERGEGSPFRHLPELGLAGGHRPCFLDLFAQSSCAFDEIGDGQCVVEIEQDEVTILDRVICGNRDDVRIGGGEGLAIF